MLVVDDFGPMLTIVRRLLSEIGIMDVDCAASVDEACRRLDARDYDLWILDYCLSGETADDLLQRVGRSAPFIFMTADERHATQLGRRAPTLAQPFTSAELLAEIQSVLGR